MMALTNDNDTIRLMAEGDARAFHDFFSRHYTQVYVFALRLVKNSMDADDIAQTVFVRLWRFRKDLTKVVNMDYYLYRMTRNTVLSFLATIRHDSFALPVDEATGICGGHTAEEQLEAEDTQLLVDLVLEAMPPQRRKVYTMSRVEGLTNDEIAQRLGIEKKTVENHLNLALREMRKVIFIYLLLMAWG